jgi:hypothetical protein
MGRSPERHGTILVVIVSIIAGLIILVSLCRAGALETWIAYDRIPKNRELTRWHTAQMSDRMAQHMLVALALVPMTEPKEMFERRDWVVIDGPPGDPLRSVRGARWASCEEWLAEEDRGVLASYIVLGASSLGDTLHVVTVSGPNAIPVWRDGRRPKQGD